jgi:hypothetical protein
VPAAVLVHLTGNIAMTLLFVSPSIGGVAVMLGVIVLIAAVLLVLGRPDHGHQQDPATVGGPI